MQELPADVFSGLSNLRILNLSNNCLPMLPVGVFNRLHNLTFLFLARNPFRGDFLLSLPNIIHGNSAIKRLDGWGTKVDKALKTKFYRVYNPKTLQEITKEYAMQYLTSEQIEELAETGGSCF